MTATTDTNNSPGPWDDHPGRSRRPGWELWGTASGLVLVGVVLTAVAFGRVPSPGHGDLLVLSRLGARVGAVVTIGLLLILVLLPKEKDRQLLGGQGTTTVLRLAAVGAGLWCASATLEVGLRYQALVGAGVWQNIAPLASFLLSDGEGSVYALQAGSTLIVLVLLILAVRAPRWGDIVRVMAFAVLATATLPLLLLYKRVPAYDDGGAEVFVPLPPGATLSDALHVVGALFWVGGLTGLLIVLYLAWRARTLPPRRGASSSGAGSPAQQNAHEALVKAVNGYSTIALIAALAVTFSGLTMAWNTLGVWWPEDWKAWSGDPKTKVYITLVAFKLAGTMVLLTMGYAHRRWTIKRVENGRPAHFAYLAGFEVTIMVLVMALGVLLTFNPAH
ncbi:CopD family protein [Kineococcus sp. SYSU DK006]|uniref:CopD family protein n=1 Tax=Kineococcus sp. SYSU DK006 TaxID=3383127 RepID=UPI003D7CE032